MAHARTHPFHDHFIGGSAGWRLMRPRIDLRLLILALGAALLGAGIAPAARHAIEAYRAATVQTRPSAESLAPVELPREWRWERKAVQFEHMYRQKR